jgi:hypothetical protein
MPWGLGPFAVVPILWRRAGSSGRGRRGTSMTQKAVISGRKAEEQ